MGLAQLGGAQLRSSQERDLKIKTGLEFSGLQNNPQMNIAKATMDVLKTTKNKYDNDFFQLYGLLPAQDGVKYNRATRSLSNTRLMSATPLASKSQVFLAQACG